MSRILLHGATDCDSSNYGDYLYGELIYDFLKKKNLDICFYNASLFFKENLKNYMEIKEFGLNKADMVIYIPGGYFGEGHKARFRDNLVQFLRFMPVGIKASYKKVPIVGIGIGAGPNKDLLMNYGIKRICNFAKFITVRDMESYNSLKKLCPNANIIEAGDLILTRTLNTIKESKQIEKIKKYSKNYKILLIHYNHSEEALIKFANAAREFIQNHKEYKIIVASDSILSYEDEYYNKFKQIFGKDCEHFIYNDPAEMTTLLKIVDVVLTCKLHVGVVSTTFGKSVIAVACHPGKTKRYYSQIKEPERCISLDDADFTRVTKMLEEYHDKGIIIPQNIIEKANKSWELLDLIIGDEHGNK